MDIYTCKSRDTLYSISRRFDTDAAKIAEVNRLLPSQQLPEGLSVIIPGCDFSTKRAAQLYLYAQRPLPDSIVRQLAPVLSAMICPCSDKTVLLSEGILPLLPVSNYRRGKGFDALFVHNIVKDSAARTQFIEECLERLEDGFFAGLCLQFNYINSFDRDGFSLLLQQLSEALHSNGLYLMLAAAPRLSQLDPDAASEALDFAAADSFCDKLLLQCYDWGHGSCAPQAMSPIPNIRQSIEYALNSISPVKLLLGISDRGYRWKLPWRHGESADAVSLDIARNLAVSNTNRIGLDRFSQTPFFTFSTGRQQRYAVFFEDALSLYKKLKLIEEYALAGAALFSSQQPSSTFIYMMGELFNPEKMA